MKPWTSPNLSLWEQPSVEIFHLCQPYLELGVCVCVCETDGLTENIHKHHYFLWVGDEFEKRKRLVTN